MLDDKYDSKKDEILGKFRVHLGNGDISKKGAIPSDSGMAKAHQRDLNSTRKSDPFYMLMLKDE